VQGKANRDNPAERTSASGQKSDNWHPLRGDAKEALSPVSHGDPHDLVFKENRLAEHVSLRTLDQAIWFLKSTR